MLTIILSKILSFNTLMLIPIIKNITSQFKAESCIRHVAIIQAPVHNILPFKRVQIPQCDV